MSEPFPLRFGRVGAALAALLLALLLSMGVASGQVSPVGLYQIDDYGVRVDMLVEPGTAGRHRARVVFSPGNACFSETRLLAMLCQVVDKEGPQYREFELRQQAARPGMLATFSGEMRFSGVTWPMLLSKTPRDWDFGHIDAETLGHERPYLAAAYLRDPNWWPKIPEITGQWQADFGSVRIEAAVARGGSELIDGSLSVHAEARPQTSAPGMIDPYLPPWLETQAQRAREQGAFRIPLGGVAGDLHFRASAAFPHTVPGGGVQLRLTPLGGVVIIEFQNLDERTFSLPILMRPMSGALTPVANDHIAQRPDPVPAPPPRPGPLPLPIEPPPPAAAGGFAGAWAVRDAVYRQQGAASSQGNRPEISVSSDETRLRLRYASGIEEQLAFSPADAGRAAAALALVAEVRSLRGSSIRDWLAGPVQLGIARDPAAGNGLLFVSGGRGVLLRDAAGGDLHADVIERGQFRSARVFFLEREGGAAQPAGAGGLWSGVWRTELGLLELRQDGQRVVGINRLDPAGASLLEGRLSASGRALRAVLYHRDYSGEINFVEVQLNGDNLGFSGTRGPLSGVGGRGYVGQKLDRPGEGLALGDTYWPSWWNGQPPAEVFVWLAFSDEGAPPTPLPVPAPAPLPTPLPAPGPGPAPIPMPRPIDGQGGRLPDSGPPQTPTGAAALVWAADLGRPCAALMALDDALWAGAADGTVALSDLRALAVILYAAGVRPTGLSNDAACRTVLVQLQAETAQRRTP